MSELIQLKILHIRIKFELFKLFIYKRMRPSSKLRGKLSNNISKNVLAITKKAYETQLFTLEELKKIYGIN